MFFFVYTQFSIVLDLAVKLVVKALRLLCSHRKKLDTEQGKQKIPRLKYESVHTSTHFTQIFFILHRTF